MTFSSSSSSEPNPMGDYTNEEMSHIFEALVVNSVRKHFAKVTTNQQEKVHLFNTSASNLFETFLDKIDPSLRQRYTCSICRKFVERYGGIVVVSSDGRTIPAMWNIEGAPELFVSAIRYVEKIVSQSPIQNIFLSEDEVWGIPNTGEWNHFAVTPPGDILFRPSLIKTAEQVIAEKKQDYQILVTALVEFPLTLAQKAYSLLTTGALYRSEKCIEIAKWFVNLHEHRLATRNPIFRDNLTWLAVAQSPTGFCHIRSTMIGTLLEDIKNGLDFTQIKSRFDAKMHPLQYQRPTAPPSDGNIDRAEKIIEKLKTAGSLERRFAKLADVQTFWVPIVPKSTQENKGVFSHLRNSANTPKSEFEVPPITITWSKFSRTVLPTATSIEYLVPASNQSYMGLVTAKNSDAPPIIQWDFEDNRNPVTWYFYTNGSSPSRWNLKPNLYHPVTAIVLQPSMWNPEKSFSHQGEKVFFILKEAKDKDYSQGCGFFCEFLPSEYHEIRSTLEAYARSAIVEGKDEAEACGIGLENGKTWNQLFRVTSKDNLPVVYKLDRWD